VRERDLILSVLDQPNVLQDVWVRARPRTGVEREQEGGGEERGEE
jgi:hypothetical protein